MLAYFAVELVDINVTARISCREFLSIQTPLALIECNFVY